MRVSKVTFSSCQDYLVMVEELGGEFHVHCDVYGWAPSVLKRLYIEFIKVKTYAKGKGYKEMYSISPNPRFCRLFCAERFGTYGDYEVMRWDLKH